MSGDVIVTVTLNAALHVTYTAGDLAVTGINPVSRPVYRAGGRGVTVARVLRAFGHDVLAAGLVGGGTGELIREDLARSGVPTAFTLIRGESRRFLRFASADPAGPVMRFGEPGPYITTEELGRFAADYRRLMAGAAAVVLCGSLPDGLPADTYGSLVTYAAEAGVPAILDAGGEELRLAVGHGPDLVVAETGPAGPGPEHLGAALIRLGAGAAAVAAGGLVRAVTATGGWTARIELPPATETTDSSEITKNTTPVNPNPVNPNPANPSNLTSPTSHISHINPTSHASPTSPTSPNSLISPISPYSAINRTNPISPMEPTESDAAYPTARGALVAGLVPGQLLGWSWPDRLRHALALAAGGAGAWTRAPGGPEDRDHVDLAAYERLLDAVRVEPSASPPG